MISLSPYHGPCRIGSAQRIHRPTAWPPEFCPERHDLDGTQATPAGLQAGASTLGIPISNYLGSNNHCICAWGHTGDPESLPLQAVYGSQSIDLMGPLPITVQLYLNPAGLKLAPIHPYSSWGHAKAPMGRVDQCATDTWGAALPPSRGNMPPAVRSPEPPILLLLGISAVIIARVHPYDNTAPAQCP